MRPAIGKSRPFRFHLGSRLNKSSSDRILADLLLALSPSVEKRPLTTLLFAENHCLAIYLTADFAIRCTGRRSHDHSRPVFSNCLQELLEFKPRPFQDSVSVCRERNFQDIHERSTEKICSSVAVRRPNHLCTQTVSTNYLD